MLVAPLYRLGSAYTCVSAPETNGESEVRESPHITVSVCDPVGNGVQEDQRDAGVMKFCVVLLPRDADDGRAGTPRMG